MSWIECIWNSKLEVEIKNSRNKNFSLSFNCCLNLKRGECIWLWSSFCETCTAPLHMSSSVSSLKCLLIRWSTESTKSRMPCTASTSITLPGIHGEYFIFWVYSNVPTKHHGIIWYSNIRSSPYFLSCTIYASKWFSIEFIGTNFVTYLVCVFNTELTCPYDMNPWITRQTVSQCIKLTVGRQTSSLATMSVLSALSDQEKGRRLQD